MFLNILIGLIMIAITVAIQAYGTTFWLKLLIDKLFRLPYEKFNRKTGKALILTAFFLLLLNFAQAFLWATMYYFVLQVTEFDTLEKALYFSLVTFTTLGYGDMIIGPSHRILSGIEAINGILLIGWSSTLMFSAMQQIWKKDMKNQETKKLTKS